MTAPASHGLRLRAHVLTSADTPLVISRMDDGTHYVAAYGPLPAMRRPGTPVAVVLSDGSVVKLRDRVTYPAVHGDTVGTVTRLDVPNGDYRAWVKWDSGHGFAYRPQDLTVVAEPYCNHDAPAVVNGVCECGERVNLDHALATLLDGIRAGTR